MIDFICHSGLGDMIVLLPAVIKVSEFDEVYVPCKPEYLKSVRSFFVDHSRVHIVGPDYPLGGEGHFPLYSGFHNIDVPLETGECWDVWFYRQLGIDWNIRYASTVIKEASSKVPQLPIPDYPYIFLHEDRPRDMIISKLDTNLPLIKPQDHSVSILAYKDLIENAAEVDVVDSCFAWLTDELDPKGRIVYHYRARKHLNPAFFFPHYKKKWEIHE